MDNNTDVPEDHATAFLGLNPSRIWADCGSDNGMTTRIREFLIQLRFHINLAKTCNETSRVPDTEIFINPWNPRNHAEALLSLDRERVFMHSLANNTISWQVLIFIARTLDLHEMAIRFREMGTNRTRSRPNNNEAQGLPAKRPKRAQMRARLLDDGRLDGVAPKTPQGGGEMEKTIPRGGPGSPPAVAADDDDTTRKIQAKHKKAAARRPPTKKKAPPTSLKMPAAAQRKSTTPVAGRKPPPSPRKPRAGVAALPPQNLTGGGGGGLVVTAKKPTRNAAAMQTKKPAARKRATNLKMKQDVFESKLVRKRGTSVKVAKTFDGVDYVGCIDAVDINEHAPHQLLFHVVYEDEDEEHMDEAELLEALMHHAIPDPHRKLSRDNAKWIEGYTPAAWSVPGSAIGHEKFGAHMEVEFMRVQEVGGERSGREITMLSSLFDTLVTTVQRQLSTHKMKDMERVLNHNGSILELFCAKEAEDSNSGFREPKIQRFMYVKIQRRNSETRLSLRNELLRIADFSRLSPRKAMARLSLLLSPSRLKVCYLPASVFVMIEEKGNVGCGFISENLLVQKLSECGMSAHHASRVNAIQVRIFQPSLGIFKGMLMRKRLDTGEEPQIQLPPSMLKVPPSTHPNRRRDAAMIICKVGVHPSPGSANEYIGRKLDPDLKDPPETFCEKIKKPLNDMVFRLWRTTGVPRHVCYDYRERSRQPDGRKHAWLVGVADPTGGLPPDTVFVPGMKCTKPRGLFVTRSPCVKYEDGRLLKHVTEKPHRMKQQDWDWLNGLSFGCIIFSNPRPGKMSIPERIALGDLDGDLYLVCWDSVVLSYINAAPLPGLDSEDDGVLSTVPSNESWLSDAQKLMQDVDLLSKLNQLTGCLYRAAEKFADAEQNQEDCLRNPNAMALFDAYINALQFTKHGGKIFLPLALHGEIPKSLRYLLTEESEDDL